MCVTARPTVFMNVAPCWRTSGRNPDAENRRRSTMVAPLAIQGKSEDERALPWNSGMAEYKMSSCWNGMRWADRAALPWDIRTAFGVPVDPEVNTKR